MAYIQIHQYLDFLLSNYDKTLWRIFIQMAYNLVSQHNSLMKAMVRYGFIWI